MSKTQISAAPATITAAPAPVFSKKSAYLWGNIITFLLGSAALVGIQLPASPDQISGELVKLIEGGSLYAVITMVVVNIIVPVFNFVRKGGKVNLLDLIGSASFWIAFGSLVVSIVVSVWGIDIPADTPQSVVGAVFGRDFAMLAFIVVANIVNPIVRYFKDKRNQQAALAAVAG